MFTSEPSLRFSWLVSGAVLGHRSWVERPLENPSLASLQPQTRGGGGCDQRNAPRTVVRSPRSDPRSPGPTHRAERSRTRPSRSRSSAAPVDPLPATLRTANPDRADGAPELLRIDCHDGWATTLQPAAAQRSAQIW